MKFPTLCRALAGLFLAGSLAWAQDVTSYGVVKIRGYRQTSAATPGPSDQPFALYAFADAESGRLTGATVQPAGKAAQPLQANGDSWSLFAVRPTQTALDTDFPNGSFTLALQTVHDGSKAISLPLTGSAYPNVPQLADFAGAQAVDPGNDFFVAWNPFTGGTANDFVRLQVRDNADNPVFQTPEFTEAGHLTGTATGASIPVGTLMPNTTYRASLLFARLMNFDTTSYGQGVNGFTAYAAETEFSLTTQGGSGGPSVVFLLGVVKGQALSQTGPGAPVLQGSSPFLYNTFVDFSTLGTGTDVTVQRLPGGPVIPLVGESDSFNHEASFATRAALDAAFPSGSYRVTVHSRDGTADATLALGGDTYPNDPHCSNFNAAQAVNPAASFTLTWDAFTGGSATDFILVEVETTGQNDHNTIFHTGKNPGDLGALNGTATSVAIPTGTLAPGTTYTARLLFAKLAASSPIGFPGATGIAGYFKQTEFALKTQGTADTTPPNLVNSTPANGAGNVPVNSAISFTFSEPMQTAYSIGWAGGLLSENFTFTWSADKRTLTATYNGNLPANSTLGWTLNPGAFGNGFRDLAGNLLAPDLNGSFSTGSGTVTGPDVKFYGVAKAIGYEQTGAGAPALEAPAYRFNSFVDTQAGGLTSATLKLPSNATQALSADGSESWGLEAEYPTQAALDAAYPNGPYTLNFNAVHDGLRAGSVNLTGDRYPNAPTIVNFAAAQAVDPAVPFTVTWNAFTGGTASDYVQFRLEDSTGQTLFESGPYGEAGSLNGTSTTVTIPAGTLGSGQTYRGQLMFAALADANTTGYGQGVTGVAAYLAETRFNVATTGTAIADVGSYVLLKIQVFSQTGPGVPALAVGTPFRFNVNVFPRAADTLLGAGVQLPGGSFRDIQPPDDPLLWTRRESFASEAALETAYPPGDYRFNFNTAHDGFRTPTLNVPPSGYPATTPHLQNYPAAQAIDPAADFTLRWDAFAGGTADDSIQLLVLDQQGNVVYPPANDPTGGNLASSATSTTIAANTLSAGHSYNCQLLFRRRTVRDTTSYPGAAGIVQFRNRTDFVIATVPAAPPTLTVTQLAPSQFKLHANGTVGISYVIEGTDSLASPVNWQPMVNFTGSANGFDFTDGVIRTQNFYRVRPAN